MESKIAELEWKYPEMSLVFTKQAEIVVSQALEIERSNRLLAQKSVKTMSSKSHLPASNELVLNSAKKILCNRLLRKKRVEPVSGQKRYGGHTLDTTRKPVQ